MAAAVQTPVVAVFGGGHWPRFLPLGSHSVTIAGEMPCFGCGWDCLFEDAPCVKLPSIEDVKVCIQDVLQPSGSKPEANIRYASEKLSPGTLQLIEKSVRHSRKRELDIAKLNSERSAHLATIEKLNCELEAVEADRAARLATIEKLSGELAEVEADRNARLATLEKLSGELTEIEADRAARLATIETLSFQLAEIETDRISRLDLIRKLSSQIEEIEADRSARLGLIGELTSRIDVIEADRAARLQVIEELDRQLNQTRHELDRIHGDLGKVRNSTAVRILDKLRLIPR